MSQAASQAVGRNAATKDTHMPTRQPKIGEVLTRAAEEGLAPEEPGKAAKSIKEASQGCLASGGLEAEGTE